jgi:hypothetical protein
MMAIQHHHLNVNIIDARQDCDQRSTHMPDVAASSRKSDRVRWFVVDHWSAIGHIYVHSEYSQPASLYSVVFRAILTRLVPAPVCKLRSHASLMPCHALPSIPVHAYHAMPVCSHSDRCTSHHTTPHPVCLKQAALSMRSYSLQPAR